MPLKYDLFLFLILGSVQFAEKALNQNSPETWGANCGSAVASSLSNLEQMTYPSRFLKALLALYFMII